MSTKTDFVKNNPAPEVRIVEAKFYALEEGEDATFAVIDGVVYQREPSQEKMRVTLGIHDTMSRLAPNLTGQQCELMYQFYVLMDDWRFCENGAIKDRLTTMLPAHAPAIYHAFFPESVGLAATQS